jgi:hypothetical protein
MVRFPIQRSIPTTETVQLATDNNLFKSAQAAKLSRKMTAEQAKAYLTAAGGDKDRAREAARTDGCEWGWLTRSWVPPVSAGPMAGN